MTSQFKMFSKTWMGTPTKQIQQHDAVEFVWKILNQYDKDATVVMGNFQIDNIDFPLLQISIPWFLSFLVSKM